MNQRTAQLIQESESGGGLMGDTMRTIRRCIVRAITGKKVSAKDCGYHAAWKAIHADLQTPLGSDASMKAWALQRVGEIAAQKISEKRD